MRILVDLPKSELDLLDEVARKLHISRAEFVHHAITASLKPHRNKLSHSGFRSWSNADEDGLAYQEKTRAEW